MCSQPLTVLPSGGIGLRLQDPGQVDDVVGHPGRGLLGVGVVLSTGLDERRARPSVADPVGVGVGRDREAEAVIRLRDVEGWNPQEVAEALEISDGNQRVLLHRARAKVRAALEEYLDPEVAK